MNEFVFPSDQDRADNEELQRVCVMLEEVWERLDAAEAMLARVRGPVRAAGALAEAEHDDPDSERFMEFSLYETALDAEDLVKQIDKFIAEGLECS